jgi:hypothetical protein
MSVRARQHAPRFERYRPIDRLVTLHLDPGRYFAMIGPDDNVFESRRGEKFPQSMKRAEGDCLVIGRGKELHDRKRIHVSR